MASALDAPSTTENMSLTWSNSWKPTSHGKWRNKSTSAPPIATRATRLATSPPMVTATPTATRSTEWTSLSAPMTITPTPTETDTTMATSPSTYLTTSSAAFINKARTTTLFTTWDPTVRNREEMCVSDFSLMILAPSLLLTKLRTSRSSPESKFLTPRKASSRPTVSAVNRRRTLTVTTHSKITTTTMLMETRTCTPPLMSTNFAATCICFPENARPIWTERMFPTPRKVHAPTLRESKLLSPTV
mmetsp:Transcript_3077/g.5807  ORF Transcript_3077/g.5807 Transcript_3077/m.5807 type:complete len:246 (-) Transcript_3077:320-1057(-)